MQRLEDGLRRLGRDPSAQTRVLSYVRWLHFKRRVSRFPLPIKLASSSMASWAILHRAIQDDNLITTLTVIGSAYCMGLIVVLMLPRRQKI